MEFLNVEIKARCNQPDQIRNVLKDHKADFKGTDHQIDTYFNVPDGRLKLRQGTIEQNLIYYNRTNTQSPKPSDINLVAAEHPDQLHQLLRNALGEMVVIDKQREIYFIDNVKFHIDDVKELGNFVEIEAIDNDGTFSEDELHKQCQHYLELLGILEKDLVAESYSDLLMD